MQVRPREFSNATGFETVDWHAAQPAIGMPLRCLAGDRRRTRALGGCGNRHVLGRPAAEPAAPRAGRDDRDPRRRPQRRHDGSRLERPSTTWRSSAESWALRRRAASTSHSSRTAPARELARAPAASRSTGAASHILRRAEDHWRPAPIPSSLTIRVTRSMTRPTAVRAVDRRDCDPVRRDRDPRCRPWRRHHSPARDDGSRPGARQRHRRAHTFGECRLHVLHERDLRRGRLERRQRHARRERRRASFAEPRTAGGRLVFLPRSLRRRRELRASRRTVRAVDSDAGCAVGGDGDPRRRP